MATLFKTEPQRTPEGQLLFAFVQSRVGGPHVGFIAYVDAPLRPVYRTASMADPTEAFTQVVTQLAKFVAGSLAHELVYIDGVYQCVDCLFKLERGADGRPERVHWGYEQAHLDILWEELADILPNVGIPWQT